MNKLIHELNQAIDLLVDYDLPPEVIEEFENIVYKLENYDRQNN